MYNLYKVKKKLENYRKSVKKENKNIWKLNKQIKDKNEIFNIIDFREKN